MTSLRVENRGKLTNTKFRVMGPSGHNMKGNFGRNPKKIFADT